MARRRGFRRSFTRLFLLTLAVTGLAKGAAFLPGYSIDEYSLVLRGDSLSLAQLVDWKGSLGRFGSAVLTWSLNTFDLSPAHARVLFVFCSIVASALFASLVVRFWNLEKSGGLAVAMACIVANHPFTAEIFTFRSALGIVFVPFLILSLLLIPRRWSPRLMVAGSALFALALTFYQVALHYSLMVVAVGTAIWLARYLLLGRAHGWPKRVVSLLSLPRLLGHRNTALLGCIVAGTALYVPLTLGLVRLLGVIPATQRISVHRLGERAQVVVQELGRRLLEPQPLIARPAQWLLLLFLAGALAGLLLHARTWVRMRASLVALAIVALLSASLVWSLGLLLFLADFWASPRGMSHVGIFWAGALAIASLCLGARARPALTAAAFLVVLSFIGSNNRVFEEQRRLNVRDAAKASRILARLEALPAFAGARSLAVDGGQVGYPLGFQTLDHDVNVSAFGGHWSKVDVLAEVSGRHLAIAEEEAQVKAAAEYCRSVEPWPGPRSVTVEGPLAILCLGSG